MLAVLSPAKNLDFSPAAHPPATTPVLASRAAELARVAKKLTAGDLKRLMKISDALAETNKQRFAAFKTDPDKAQGLPAALAFNGDVYRGLEARTLSAEDLSWSQDHVRILSGLYGALRPLDAIQPYRLEMGTRLATKRGETLYDFWGRTIAKALNEALATHDSPILVNLASKEYFSAVDPAALQARVVTPVFKDVKGGKGRILQFYAKRARGLMARWIIRNRVDDLDALRAFDAEGYRFRTDASDDGTWVFERPQPATKAA